MRDDKNEKAALNRGNPQNQGTAGSDSVNEIPEDPELRSLLRTYEPHPSLSLENRIMSSYSKKMGPVHATVSCALYWTWRVAVIAALGTVLLLVAMHLSTSNHVAEAPTAPAFATAEQRAKKTAEPVGQHATVVAPDSGNAVHNAEPKSLESGTRIASVSAPTALTSTSSGQITVGTGNPTYIPIAEALPEEPGAVSEYVLTGVVTSEHEEPLPGAIVSIYSSKPTTPDKEWPAPTASQRCDAEGHYTIHLNAPMPSVVVLIEKTGFIKMEDLLSMRAPGTSVKNYKLPVPVACIEGRVFAGESEPLARARVGVGGTWGGGITVHASYISGVTDASGRFTLAGLPAGRMTVSASARGFIRDLVNGPKMITLKAGPCEQVELHLKPGNTISFVVKNRLGAVINDPVGSLLLSLNPSFTARMQNGEPGTGRLEWVLAPDAPSVPCTVSADGYKANMFGLDPKAPPVEVILEQADIISGRVVSETGRPVQGAKVTVVGTRRDGGMPPPLEGVADTDADGRFVLPLSNPPVSQISVTRQGYVEQKLVFDTRSAPPIVEFRLPFEGAGIFGKVFDSENHPVKRFSIIFGNLPSTSNPIFSRQIESEDGAFSIKDVPAGVYRIHVQSESGDPLILSAVLNGVEIRKGFMYGPILVPLLSPKSK